MPYLKNIGCAVGLLWTTGLQGLGTAGPYGQLLEEGGPHSLLGSSSDGWRTWALIWVAVEECIHRHLSCLSSCLSLCCLWRWSLPSTCTIWVSSLRARWQERCHLCMLLLCLTPQWSLAAENCRKACLVLGPPLNWWWGVGPFNSRAVVHPKFVCFCVV